MSDTPSAEEVAADPRLVRVAVKKAAATLIECYGAGALDRARLLEKSARDGIFAKLVTNEVVRLQNVG